MASAEANFSQNPPVKPQKLFLGVQVFLRALAAGTTFAATWLMLTNRQSYQFGFVTMKARYDYSPEFKFFAIADIVACACTVISLLFVLLLVGRCGSNPSHYFLLFFHDLTMMSLVLAGNSAATAISILGKKGNTHIGWMAICGYFDKFCNRTMLSLALSYLALISLLILTILSVTKSRSIKV